MSGKKCLHWATVWNKEILPALSQRRLMIACGFDGVIAPLTASHADIELFERTKTLLRKLSQSEQVTLVFLSSRELPDLKARIGLHSVSYCGNNGMQIETPDFHWESEQARKARRSLGIALESVRTAFAGRDEISLEDRQLSFTVRSEAPSDSIRKSMCDVFAAIEASHSDLRVVKARNTWEVRPNLPINTGAALRFLLERSTLDPRNILVIGTEDTDLSAFDAFKDSVTIQIGDTESSARFRANDASDVAELLFCIYVARKGRREPLTQDSEYDLAPGDDELAVASKHNLAVSPSAERHTKFSYCDQTCSQAEMSQGLLPARREAIRQQNASTQKHE